MFVLNDNNMSSTTEKSGLITGHSLDEMALFSIPHKLQKARGLTNGQLTPPSSPDQVQHNLTKTSAATKRQAQRWITRQYQKAKPTANTRKPESANLGDSTKPVEQSSPQHFKTTESQPGSFSSSIDQRTSNKQLTAPPIELRRVLHSYDDLRRKAIEQEKDQDLALQAISTSHTPLLPSPVIDERRNCFNYGTGVSLDLQKYKHLPHARNHSTYKSYDEMQILSCYEDDRNTSSETTNNPDIFEASLGLQTTLIRNQDLEMSTPLGQSFKEKKAGFDSPESDWLANSTSHQQRLCKFKARCFQVVQHPFSVGASPDEDEGKVMLATLLVGPGKPKLVQIQRPSSSNSSSTQSPQSVTSPSARYFDSTDGLVAVPPSTPVQQCKEVSAFSPYDTPSVILPSAEQSPFTASKLDLVPGPLSISRAASSGSDETVFSPVKCGISGNSSGKKHLLPDIIWKEQEFFKLQHCTIEKALDMITTVVADFPNNMTHLESPLLNRIRKNPSKSKNEAHIATLSKIFPNTPAEIVTILAAWIIIDSYVSGLYIQQGRDRPSHQIRLSPQHSFLSPEQHPLIPQRSASLGKPIRRRRIGRSQRQQQQQVRKPSTYRLFPFCTPPLPAEIDYQTPATAPGNSVMSSLSSLPMDSQAATENIPHKARSVLGINDDENVSYTNHDISSVLSLHHDESLIATHARALSLSIGVVAQQLLQVITADGHRRGSHNSGGDRGVKEWDAHLWRALGVVVDAIERQDQE